MFLLNLTPDKAFFPREVLCLLEKEGLRTEHFLFGTEGDMDNEGRFCSSWLAFDEKGLYVAFGSAQIGRKKGNKRLETAYSLTSLQSIPFTEIEELKTEKYVSTGRLIAVQDGEDVAVTRFSVGCLAAMDDFCRCFNEYKKKNDISAFGKLAKDRLYCPKCGTPFPKGQKVCPACSGEKSIVRRLFQFFGGYKRQVAALILFMLVSTGVTLVTPQISTRTLFDNVLNAGNTASAETIFKSLVYVVLAIFGIRFLSMIFSAANQYLLGSIMPRVIYDIKVKIFAAMQRLSVGFYSSKQTGSLMERVTRDANNIYWFFIDGLPYVIVSIITIVGVLGFMFAMSWQLTLIVLLMVPILWGCLLLGDKIFTRLHHRQWMYNAKLSSMVSDNINGQRIIKAFSKEDRELERFKGVSSGLLQSEMKLSNTEATLFPSIYAAASILTTVVLVAGSLLVLRGEMTLGSLLSFTVYLSMLQSPIEFFSWVSNWWARCVDSARRVFEIVDTEPEIVEKEAPVKLEDFRGDIEISELEFEYEPARPVIKRLNLRVKVGEMLGVVGKTGTGKTTIANLIARLYDAKAGTVKIDGVDVKDLPLKELRANIGLVSQDIYLFIGTIADNIRYANPGATMEQVIAAAKAASAHDFIMKLPDAYETRVGAGGQDLSGGERQRVSIARTIIQNPKILILDEATAAMDTATERNIQESLSGLKSGRTTISIAHRLSTLRDADMLAVIEDGQVTEYGSFVDLIRKKGEFYHLYQIQAEALKAVGIGD